MDSRLLTLIPIFGLAACGGGGGGGGGDSSPIVTPPPVISPTEPESLYQGLLSKADLNAETSPLFIDAIVDDIIATGFDSTNIDDGNSTVQGNSIVGACGGSATFDDQRTQSLLGKLSLDFDQFDDCSGTVLNGELVVDTIDYDESRAELIKAEFEFNRIQIKSSESDLIFQGELLYELKVDSLVEQFTMQSFELQDNISAQQYWFVDYSQYTQYQNRDDLTQIIKVSYDGRLYLSEYGYVDISSGGELFCAKFIAFDQQTGCDLNAPNRERMKVLGNQNSALELSFLAHDVPGYGPVLNIEIDIDGDSVTDERYIRHLGESSSNSLPFAYAGVDRIINVNQSQQVILSASQSFDRDGDNLSYSWEIDTSNTTKCVLANKMTPKAESVTFSDASSAELTATVSDYGDYCFKLTVRDDDNGSNTDYAVVRFNKTELFTEHFHTIKIDQRVHTFSSMESIDINNDGVEDIMVFNEGDSFASFLISNMEGGFDFHSQQATAAPLFQDLITIADVNADGRQDLLMLAFDDTEARLSYQSFSDTAELQTANSVMSFDYLVLPDIVGRPELADFNGDGRIDVMFRGIRYLKTLFVSLQTESGFSDLIRHEVTGSVKETALGDFDGDNSVEILTVSRGSNLEYDNFTFRFWRPTSGQLEIAQEFTQEINCASFTCRYSNLSINDIDNDGNADVLVLTRTHAIIFWQKNGEIESEFIALDSFPEGFDTSSALDSKPARFADFNNDGLTDIIANMDTDYSLLLLQNETATFSNSVRIPFVANNAIVDDINADGKVDIVSLGKRELHIRLGQD